MLCRKLVRGFTILEFIAILIVAFVATLAVISVIGGNRHHEGSRQLKDSAQIRGVMQAMSLWAGNHQDNFPLPSAIDIDNTTVSDPGPAKDTTANILSLMVFNGTVPAEILVSPAESNANIQQCTGYTFTNPKSAVEPAKALWDPSFSADFSGGKTGNTSYAHLLPSGARLPRWTNSFDMNSPILGNRGPQVASVTKNPDGTIKANVAKADSNTFLIHGGRTTWEGNIGFADAHVDFEINLTPSTTHGLTYKDAGGKLWPDLFNYDEPDDPTGTNAFLGIFTKAGPKPSDFTAIWD